MERAAQSENRGTTGEGEALPLHLQVARVLALAWSRMRPEPPVTPAEWLREHG